jgi:hypothetical protein
MRCVLFWLKPFDHFFASTPARVHGGAISNIWSGIVDRHKPHRSIGSRTLNLPSVTFAQRRRVLSWATVEEEAVLAEVGHCGRISAGRGWMMRSPKPLPFSVYCWAAFY